MANKPDPFTSDVATAIGCPSWIDGDGCCDEKPGRECYCATAVAAVLARFESIVVDSLYKS